jgi:hypothetical protein
MRDLFEFPVLGGGAAAALGHEHPKVVGMGLRFSVGPAGLDLLVDDRVEHGVAPGSGDQVDLAQVMSGVALVLDHLPLGLVEACNGDGMELDGDDVGMVA